MLIHYFMSIPPRLKEAEQVLKAEALSSRELMQLALAFVEKCRWEEGAVHAPYLYQVVELLLCRGLDPKEKRDGYDLLSALIYVEHGYAAADTLALLFEHGADPNWAPGKDEGAFEQIDFDVWFGALEQENRQTYDAWLHSWMVFLGYGSRIKQPVRIFKEYDSEELFDLKNCGSTETITAGCPWKMGGFVSASMTKKPCGRSQRCENGRTAPV